MRACVCVCVCVCVFEDKGEGLSVFLPRPVVSDFSESPSFLCWIVHFHTEKPENPARCFHFIAACSRVQLSRFRRHIRSLHMLTLAVLLVFKELSSALKRAWCCQWRSWTARGICFRRLTSSGKIKKLATNVRGHLCVHVAIAVVRHTIKYISICSFRVVCTSCAPTRAGAFHSQVQKVNSPNLLKRKCISEVVRIETPNSSYCDVIFLARLQGKFKINRSWE